MNFTTDTPPYSLILTQPVCPDVPKLTERITSNQVWAGAFFYGFFCLSVISNVNVKSSPRPWRTRAGQAEAEQAQAMQDAYAATLDDARALHTVAGHTCIFAMHITHSGGEYNEVVSYIDDGGQWRAPTDMSYLYNTAAEGTKQ